MPDLFTAVPPKIIGGDVAYLAKKEFDGKLRTDEGFLSATGDLATLTANTGKDMYLARAKCVFHTNGSSSATNAANDRVELLINAVIVETAKYTQSNIGNNSPGVMALEYEFKNVGHKVAASQVIKLEVVSLDSETDVEGFIEVWEEDTGVDPSA